MQTTTNEVETTITLTRENGSWMATYSGNGSEDILALFGSFTVPTAYRSNCSSVMVQTAVSMRNPSAVVVVAGKDS